MFKKRVIHISQLKRRRSRICTSAPNWFLNNFCLKFYVWESLYALIKYVRNIFNQCYMEFINLDAYEN